MKNQVYRIYLTDKKSLEFFVCDTNEVNPHRDIKELAINVINKDDVNHGDLDEDGLYSLIKYLQDCMDYIKDFNSKSKPEKSEEE